MAEWIFEDGIGEQRAALIAQDTILEVALDWKDQQWGAGAIILARLGPIDRAAGKGVAVLEDGSHAILDPLPPPPMGEGMRCTIEILREPIGEGLRLKAPKARVVPPETTPRAAPGLEERLAATDLPVRRLAAHEPDLLERAGWSELLEQAVTGHIPFAGGSLTLSVTPAMALFDVDGVLERVALASAGAAAAARAIRRLDIGGAIGIDLPSPKGKAERQAAAGEIDRLLPQPFERTAVNGFGFLQIVRRRQRRSLPEMIAGDPEGVAARALLRQAERCGGAGALVIRAAPAVIARIEAEGGWQEDLARRAGRSLILQADVRTPRWGGHVQPHHI